MPKLRNLELVRCFDKGIVNKMIGFRGGTEGQTVAEQKSESVGSQAGPTTNCRGEGE